MTLSDREAFDRATRGATKQGRANGAASMSPDISTLALTPAAWAARELPATDHLLGELFSTTCRALLVADTGLGKTMFAVALAFAMHLGRGFLHWSSRRNARVLFVDGEMPRDLMQERLRIACAWFGVKPPTDGLFFLSREDVEDMPPLDSEDGQVWLDTFLAALGGVDFIVFDNFMSLCASDLRDEEGWQSLKPYVLALTRRRIGQLWLHHVGHDKTRSYGAKAREWHMDVVMLGEACEASGADVALKLTFTKARRRKPTNRDDFETMQIELRSGQWSSAKASTDAPGKKIVALPPGAAIALEQLRIAVAQTGTAMPAVAQIPRGKAGVREVAWRDRAYLAGISAGAGEGSSRKAFSRAKEKLVASGLVGCWGEWAWLP